MGEALAVHPVLVVITPAESPVRANLQMHAETASVLTHPPKPVAVAAAAIERQTAFVPVNSE